VAPEALAQLALSLRDNEAYQAALDAIRSDAIDTLVSVDPDDKNTILLNQATVKVVDDLKARIDQMIRSAAAKKKPGLA
jgi:hypothetical protein